MNINLNAPTFGMPLRGLLLIAGIYAFIWGGFFKWFGDALVKWLSMGEVIEGLSTNIFGTFGMVIGVSIFLSAFYPFSWFYLMVAGAVGKLLSTGWFLFFYVGEVGWNKRSIFHLAFNELLWLAVLLFIVYRAHQTKKHLKSMPLDK